MRRSHWQLVLFLAGLTAGLTAGAGYAGDYHQPGDLVCSDCHAVHYSPQGGSNPRLLKQTVTSLCLSCHDGQTGSGNLAPDVLGQAGPGQPASRAAGAFPEVPGAQTQNGHSLLVSAAPPGGGGPMTLDCLSCHSPHGNSYYRNLVANPGGKSGLGVTAVTQGATTPTSVHYSAGNVRYGNSDGGLSDWCGGCHGDFHGRGGTPNLGGGTTGDTNQAAVSPWLRHPTRDVTMAQAYSNQHIDSGRWFSALPSRLPVVSRTGIIPGSLASSDNEIFCGTCHKAHGSSHASGLIWDNADSAEPEDGASLMDTCQQCHYK